MVSLEVMSLFTRVPIVESLNLLSQHFSEDITALFKLVLTSMYLSFGGQFYDHIDGVAVGSLLSPVIANLFAEDLEERALEQATHKPLCWLLYVDDSFMIWAHGPEEPERFLIHLNGILRNIHFSMETEKHGHRPFFIFLFCRRSL
jgi:hypothetical protein